MAGLKSYFEHSVMDYLERPLTKTEYDVFCATLEAVADKAHGRARLALLKVLGGVQESGYLHDSTVHALVDLLADVLVAAVLVKDPATTSIEMDPVLMSGLIGQFTAGSILPAGKSGLPAASHSHTANAALSLADLQKAAAEVASMGQVYVSAPQVSPAEKEAWLNANWDEASPSYQGETKTIDGVLKIFNGSAWVEFKKPALGAKKGLFEEPAPPAAVDELLQQATGRAKDLKAQRLRDAVGAKYEELTGKTLSPEEAEELVIKAIEEKGN